MEKKRKKNEWEKDFKKKKSNAKDVESCANFKEEIITLPQMNILRFSKATLQANNKYYLISFSVLSH